MQKSLIFSILFIFISSTQISGQGFIHHYSSVHQNILRKVIANNTSIYIAGTLEDSAEFNGHIFRSLETSSSTQTGKSGDVFVSKLDTSGKVQWAKIMGGAGYSDIKGLIQDNNGDIVTLVSFNKIFRFGNDSITGKKGADCGLIKINEKGEKIWAKAITSNDNLNVRYITSDESNNIYITINCEDTLYIDNIAYYENFIKNVFIKIDGYGNVKWVKILNNTKANEYFVVTCIKPQSNGELIVAGNASAGEAYFDGQKFLEKDTASRFFILRMKEDNTIMWKSIAKGGGGYASFIEIGNEGDIYFSGLLFGYLNFENLTITGIDKMPYHDILFGKFTKEGKAVWMKAFGNKGTGDIVYGLKYRDNEKLYLSATYWNDYKINDSLLKTTARIDGYLAEFDINGNMTKIHSTKGDNNLCISSFPDFDFDSQGNLYLAGSLNFMVNLGNVKISTAGQTDGFLWKIPNFTSPTNIDNSQSDFSNFSFNLYPNPNTGKLYIDISIINPEKIKFELTDITGRTIVLKQATDYIKGKYQESFDLKEINPGCYFIRATTGNNIQTRKLIITEN